MRVAVVINTSWNIWNFRRGLVKALQAAGHEVLAIAPPDAYSARLESELGCRYVPILMENKGTNPLKDAQLTRRFLTVYKRERPDVGAADGAAAVTFEVVFLLCYPMKYYKLAILLLAALGAAGAAHAAPPAPGPLIYQKNCQRCHGKDGRLGLNGAHDLTKSNLNAFGRTYLVTSGMGKMPAFGKALTPAQVQQVVAYSLTLK